MPDRGKTLTEEHEGALQPGEDQQASAVAFGQILKRWLEATGKKQNELAQALHVSDSVMSRWITGKRRPNAPMVTKILIELYDWMGEDWQVMDALDGFLCLGLEWEDVAASLEGVPERRAGGPAPREG